MTFNELIPIAHGAAKEKGFWPEGEKRSLPTLLMLIISECAEALEADRAGRMGRIQDAGPNDVLQTDGNTFVDTDWFLENIKDGVADELSDVVIRLADLCGGLGIEPDPCKYTLNDFRDHSVPAMLYFAVEELTNSDESRILEDRVSGCLRLIELLAYDILDIDLERHIELKLEFNRSRPAKHNKKY